MTICSIDRGMDEVASTKGANFSALLNSYQYRTDKLPEDTPQEDYPIQLAQLNEKVAGLLNLHEVALSWQSLAKLASELVLAKK